jgi:hypothetical protein
MAIPAPGNTAAAKASGARATLSIRPSTTSERQSTRTPAGQRGYRRTTATRIASSKRPGKDNSHQRSAAVSGRKRKHLWPLVGREQPSPAIRLESLGKKKQEPGRHQHTRVSAREPPGGRREMARSQECQRDDERSRAGGKHPSAAPRTTEPPERSDQQAIPALKDDRRKWNGDRGKGSRWRRSPGGSGVGAAFMALSLQGHAPIREVA